MKNGLPIIRRRCISHMNLVFGNTLPREKWPGIGTDVDLNISMKDYGSEE